MCNTKICTDRGESFRGDCSAPLVKYVDCFGMNLDARDVLLIASNVNTMDVSNVKKQSHLMKEKTLEIVLTAQRVRKRFVLDTDF